jgi:hypothetical protein
LTSSVPPGRADDEAPTIFLHIGTMKSGTSYIQGMLSRNRAALRSDGVLFPGEKWTEQVDATRQVLGGAGAARSNIEAGTWTRMAKQMTAWPGRSSIMSMELLSFAEPDKVGEIAESLEPAEVHAIITVRDLARVIPSAWQESTQNRQTWTWPDYVASLTGESDVEPLAFKRFWKQHDVAAIAASWAAVLGKHHVHVVTVPPSGGPRDELWKRFCTVVGLEPDAYRGANEVRGNPAVGAASAEFLRRLNVEIAHSVDIGTYDQLVKRFLAKNTLAHREGEVRLSLPSQYRDWAVTRARELADGVRATGVDVVGDLDELIPQEDTELGAIEVAEHDVADAAVNALEALVLRLAGIRRERLTGRDPE